MPKVSQIIHFIPSLIHSFIRSPSSHSCNFSECLLYAQSLADLGYENLDLDFEVKIRTLNFNSNPSPRATETLKTGKRMLLYTEGVGRFYSVFLP